MGDGLDVVVKEETCKKQVTLNGRKFLIGKLGIVQQAGLVNFCIQLVLKFQDKIKKINTKGKNWIADLYNIIEILPSDEIEKLCSILLDTKDIEFCKKLGPDDLTEIVATVLENNNIERIIKNVSRVIRATKTINLKEMFTP